jgi:S-adenosylmethionine hydrolase
MILEEKPEMIIGIPLEKDIHKDTVYCAETMGNAIQQLVHGESVQTIGEEDISYIEKNHLRPVLDNNWMEGQIIFIDNFENVIVNITREQFEEQRKGRSFNIVFVRNEVIDRISETYADVPQGEKLALFNSAGYLEIAINKGNAAGLFGLKGFSEKASQAEKIRQAQLFYQTVRIVFE